MRVRASRQGHKAGHAQRTGQHAGGVSQWDSRATCAGYAADAGQCCRRLRDADVCRAGRGGPGQDCMQELCRHADRYAKLQNRQNSEQTRGGAVADIRADSGSIGRTTSGQTRQNELAGTPGNSEDMTGWTSGQRLREDKQRGARRQVSRGAAGQNMGLYPGRTTEASYEATESNMAAGSAEETRGQRED